MEIYKVFFFHNPKAAGTSIAKFLSDIAETSRTCPLIENDIVGHIARNGEYSTFKGYTFYHGHYGWDIFSQVNAGHKTVSNFRHPLDRVVSIYNYFRNTVKLDEESLKLDRYFAVRAAKTCEFSEFIRIDDVRVKNYLSNQHFRQIIHSPWEFFDEAPIDDARARIRNMDWYYVCGWEQVSLGWASEVFSVDNPKIDHLNISIPAGDNISVADLDMKVQCYIENMNIYDLKIFDYAVQLIQSRHRWSGWSRAARS